jgi:hypothetical protein
MWFLAMILTFNTFGQSVGDYQTKATGNWNTAATWETWNGSAWVESGTPTSANGVIRILDGHTVTVSATVTVDQVVIEVGGQVTLGTSTLTIANGLGVDMIVNGTLRQTAFFSSSITIVSLAEIQFGDGGRYQQQRTSPIPSATWHVNSTCEIYGITNQTTSISNIGQSFGNFEWNCTGQTNTRQFVGSIPSSINGKLIITSTGSGVLSLSNSSSAISLSVGNLEVMGGTFVVGNSSGNASLTVTNNVLVGQGNFYVAGTEASNTHTLTVNGSFTQIGGFFEVCRTNFEGTYSATINGTAAFSGGNARIMNNSGTGGRVAELTIVGNTTINGGIVDLSAAGSTNTGRLFIRNNLNLSSGGLIFTQGITAGSSGVYFDRNGGAQTFTWSGGTLSTASGGVGRRFCYRTVSGPADLNEVYSANTAQETVNGSQGSPIANYAVWPTSAGVIKNLTIDNAAGVTLSTAKTVNETLTLANGTFILSNTLTLANNSNIIRSGGSFSAAPTFGNSVNVNYAQYGSTIVSGFELPSASTTLNNLSINTTNGVTLNDSRTVNGTLFLTNGRLNTGACNSLTTSTTLLTLSDDASVSDASAISYVNGVMRKIGNDAFTFPVGDALEYAPIGISAPTVITDVFGACYAGSSSIAISSNLDSGIENISACEHWNLNRLSGSSSVNVTLSWDTRSCGIMDPSELLVARYNGTSWENLGNTGTTGSNSSGTITSNSVSSFSPFTLGSSSTANNPLPVELTAFNVHCEGTQVELSWTTASEYNASHYIVEKSRDGQSWNSMAQINASGTTNQTNHYSCIVQQNTHLTYYRLIQFDYDGISDSLMTISSLCVWENDSITVLPNPNKGEFTISRIEEGALIQIVNIMGQVVYEETASSSFIAIDANTLQKGLFLLRTESDEQQTVTKFVVD